MTVPAFGDWDMKNGAMPDYSMDFSKIREMRKQNKKELSRASLGGDDDLLAHHKQQQQQQQQQPSKAPQPTKLGAPAKDHGPLHGRDDSPTIEKGKAVVPPLEKGNEVGPSLVDMPVLNHPSPKWRNYGHYHEESGPRNFYKVILVAKPESL
ncbi:hypothetical protein D1007_01895 [Hordeum vulgare]|nr:hypothetical protein D1007_01895 [Hordeum vulgare]